MFLDQIEALKASIDRIRSRGISVPVDDIVLLRTLILVGRGLAQMTDEAMRPTGLGEAEFRVLMELYSRNDGVGNPGELCVGSSQSPANMSRITDTLVARNLITRDPSTEDRRRMILRLTSQGETLARDFVPAAFAPIRKLFATLSREARTQLLAGLNDIAKAFDASIAPPAPGSRAP